MVEYCVICAPAGFRVWYYEMFLVAEIILITCLESETSKIELCFSVYSLIAFVRIEMTI